MCCESVAWIVAELMELEVAAKVGAGLGQRTPDRVAQRNGYRARSWDTRVGELEPPYPQAADRQLLPSFLERGQGRAGVGRGGAGGLYRRGVDPAGGSAGRAAGHRRHVQGPGVAVVPRPGRAGAGVPGERPLEGRYPYLWLDAKVERVREPGGVRHKALVIAYGVHQERPP